MAKSCLGNVCIIEINLLVCSVTILSLFAPGSLQFAMAAGNETDRIALISIKGQLVGGSSDALNSWNASLHFCDWEGVTCGRRHQRVTALNLSGLQLGGSISPSIGNLTFLRRVDLSENSLQGNIPKELGHLRRLRVLDLNSNKLQGQIPEEITNCSNLQNIDFHINGLTGGVPSWFGLMSWLVTLDLDENQFTGSIPAALGNISSLMLIILATNHLEGRIPEALGRPSNLQYFMLGDNNLYGTIPPSLYNLSSMEFLDLGLNKLSGSFVPEIGTAFPNLRQLFIGSNRFTGTIPRSIANISGLQHCDLGLNGFSGSVPHNLGTLKDLRLLILDYNNLGSGKEGDLDFVSSLGNCSLFEDLIMHHNRFGGRLPESTANLSTQMRRLYMGENQITGSIPKAIGNLVNLNVLYLGNLFLTGSIPVSIGKLQNLEGLLLSSSHFSGELPSSLGNLSELSTLELSNNNLEGRIPQSLVKCERMQKLDLSRNKLNASIPNQLFGEFKSLFYLNLSHNSFTGHLPLDLGSLKNLAELYVDNNNFTGEIPSNLGQSSGIRILYMQRNSFQGSIPSTFGSLRSLEVLDLSSNNLSGNIPLELEKLPFLVRLNLSFNQLEGEIPKQGVFKNVSGFSFKGNKKLCGGIVQLELPKCLLKKHTRRANIHSTKVIIAIILSLLVASILAVLLVYLFCKRRSRMELIPVALLGDGYLRVSYKELLQATGSFASSNLVGSGAFGSVYKGILHQQEKPVAVKVLNLQNHKIAKSFMAECKVFRKVRHRNIVKVITSCSSIDYQGNDFKALVFEFMPNGSLDSWLHEHSEWKFLNFVQRLGIAIDVANAMDYLHHDCETLIVHCDLKPSNVLLDDEMIAHVSDFGLSRLVSSHSSNMGMHHTNSSMMKGTIGYVPPEYGMGGVASPEGDIYSYGILLLEMITGRRPTDSMFNDSLSLHNFCKMAIPERLKKILDIRLLEQIREDTERISRQEEGKIWECLVSFTKIGVACSAEVPGERMSIKDVITELHAIKASLLQTRMHRGDRRYVAARGESE